MEFLEPELQKTYEKCKYIVKVWEHQFKKKHKRVPSKFDIREANRDVRNAYRKYFQLKTAILEQSFKGVDGFDDLDEEDETEKTSESQLESNSFTELEIIKSSCSNSGGPEQTAKSAENEISPEIWGSHLNNPKDEDQQEEKDDKPKLNLNITKKLFCGSKFSKRNPRKSLSFSQKNKTDNDNTKVPQSQPTPSFTSFSSEEAINFLQNDILDKPFSTVSHLEGSLSQTTKVVQTFLENTQPRFLKTVDPGWLERVAQNTGTLQENSNSLLYHEDDHNTEFTKVDYDSEDIIENSDEEVSFKTNPLHVAKKRKMDNLASTSNCEMKHQQTIQQVSIASDIEIIATRNDENTISTNEGKSEEATEVAMECYNVENEVHENVKNFTNEGKVNEEDKITELMAKGKNKTNASNKAKRTPKKNMNKLKKNIGVDGSPENVEEVPKKIPRRNAKLVKIPKKTDTQTPNKPIQNASQISQRKSARKNKVKVSLQEFSSGEEDAFHTDTDEKDPEFALFDGKKRTANYEFSSDEESTTKKSTPVAKKEKSGPTSTTKRRGKKKEAETEIEEETDTYDLEFSIKPRIVAPRYSNIRSVLLKNKSQIKGKSSATSADPQGNCDEKEQIKDKQQQAKEKLEQKIHSGNLNDNFVRINIKKKVFARGKSGINFSKYKKSQWKKAKALAGPDMDMGGCDGGMLVCFNCGQEGHFAQQCKATKGDRLLPLATEEEEEECPFPTLEEASKMAQEGHLNIRRSKFALKEIQNSEIIDDESHIVKEDDVFDDFDSETLLMETLKLEEHVKKLDVQMYMDNVKVVEPFYKLKEDNTVIDTPPQVFEALEKFGHSSFRPGQEQAIMRILSGKSTLVTLSTGSGKSLCYQLPAYLYSQREPCISLIISPLVSLMDDQVMGIAKFMKAACLHSNQTAVQRKKILEAISLGELSILLVSPEAVVSGEKQRGFSSFLRKLPPIAFACIDEAHCVSQWSHNFRPSYLMICRVLRQSLGVKTILGLTATATKATQTSIIEHLQIPDGESGVISDIPLPDNLVLSVSKDPNRDFALVSLLLSDRFKDCDSIIVYCTRRQECERIAGLLRTSLKNEKPVKETTKKRKRVNLQAEPYHAGLSASRRRTIQNAFMSGELKIVVATVAFGMGINKSDIRAVIHYNMPSSFESYVQEVGRAGRDGLKAHCHVFLDSRGGDENELRRHIHSDSIDRYVIRKLLEKIFIPCSCKGQCPKHEVAFSIESTVRALDIPEENISTLLCYLELHDNRYIELLSPAYTKCKVISYSGPLQIRKVAKDCPPLAMALALHKNKEGKDANILDFPVVDVASAMGWESGICKHKLKNLEWTTVNNQPKRSAINVQFYDLGFRLLAPGNLSDDQLDEALDNLHKRVIDQERTALLQLNAIHQTLLRVAKPSFSNCSPEEGDKAIKSKVREYFNSPDPLSIVPEIQYPKYSEEQLVSDIHGLISMYRDNNFTGRAVARIFQGIQSPNYPAVIWGRCKFWRSHLDKDFHVIVKTAAREIVKMR